MADGAPKSQLKELYSEHANPISKFFLYKATFVTVFLVLLPLLPSVAPDFINQTLHARSWELLQMIFVGIAVSYGLFSKRNIDESSQKDNNSSCAKVDNAQSYVSKLLQVSSVFDDEPEISHTVIEENKFQALNSQYFRGEPVVHVVAKENNPAGEEEKNGVVSQISQKPLLLPVRSLKQRVSDEVDRSERVNSKKLSTGSEKSRFGGVVGGLNIVNKMEKEEEEEENVVLRSPIPWRSRSGRMEVEKNGNELQTPTIPSPSMEEKESNTRIELSRSIRSCRANAKSKSLSKSQSNGGEEIVRKKNFSSPPPAPPPPPSPALLRKSNSSIGSTAGSAEKVLRRSARSVPMEELNENKTENNLASDQFRVGRTFKTSELEMAKESKEFVESSDDEEESGDDRFDDSLIGSSSAGGGDNGGDVGPDVDKKADEFIAKFREQIRLQRIESIRRTTAQRAGKSLR